jgi:hypothetical protein
MEMTERAIHLLAEVARSVQAFFMHPGKSYYFVVKQVFMMNSAHQKYISPFYKIAMHRKLLALG